MVLITASEFRKNQKKYFQAALHEKVGVKSGGTIFEITPSKELRVNPSPSGDPFWDDPRNVEELERRISALRSGKSASRPWAEVKKELGI